MLKRALKRTPIPRIHRRVNSELQVLRWKRGKLDFPPHLLKERVVRRYGKEHALPVFVETGTLYGDMVAATKRRFSKIYSVELDGTLYALAKERFSRWSHITILQGDSADVLKGILGEIDTPCLFWLDAHYSGGITAKGRRETPIVEEVQQILGHYLAQRHVILIDDARLFDGTNDYPTLEELRASVVEQLPNLTMCVQDDIIRLHQWR